MTMLIWYIGMAVAVLAEVTAGNRAHANTECKTNQRGTGYQGTKATTENDRECQRWDSHNIPDYKFPGGSKAAAGNYCRNPGGESERIWCYTIHHLWKWDWCDVPDCDVEVSKKSIVAWRNAATGITRYTNGHRVSPGIGFEKLTGNDTLRPGTSGRVEGFQSSHDAAGWDESDETILRVCRLLYPHGDQMQSLFHILTLGECEALRPYTKYPEGTFVMELRNMRIFVSSRRQNGNNPPSKFTLLLCKRGDDDLVSSFISRSCPENWEEMKKDKFYAFGGGLFCAEPQEQFRNGNVDPFDTYTVYSCDEGYTLSGTNRRFCTEAGFWDTDVPECKRISCGDEPTIEHGSWQRVEYADDQLKLTCRRGYQASSTFITIRCGSDTTWSENDVTCKPIYCGPPMAPLSGRVETNTNEFGDVARWSCERTYRLVGPTSAVCQEDGSWNEATPRCKKISCRALQQPDHGLIIGRNFDVGSSVEFSCYEEFTLIGSSEVTCMHDRGDGVWTDDEPTCRKHECSPPSVPEHGTITGTDFTFGSRVHYNCDVGHMRDGVGSARCTREGWNSEPPTCQAVACNDPGTPHRGSRQTSQPGFVYNTEVTFSCDPGHGIIGVSMITCLDTGTWSTVRPQCVAIECVDLPSVAYGTRESSRVDGLLTITFQCYPGYEMEGSQSSTCQNNQLWSHDPPVCRACRVGTYKPSMGAANCAECPTHSTTLQSASSSTEQCICRRGTQKTDSGESCEDVYCNPALSAPSNGDISRCSNAYNNMCTFTCDEGFIMQGSEMASCMTHGWTSDKPFCDSCPANSYKSSPRMCSPCPSNSQPNRTAGVGLQSCVCRPGFQMGDGQACIDVDECAVDDGGCSHGCRNTVGSFHCYCDIPGYELMDDERTCYANKSCSDNRGVPDAGDMTCVYTNHTNGYICHFKCNPGYQFVSGNNYITCGPDTQYLWSHRRVNTTARIPSCTPEFFVNVRLPMKISYTSSEVCNAVSISSSLLQEVIKQQVEGLTQCNGTCRAQSVTGTCVDTDDGDGGYSGSTYTVAFTLLLENPHMNAVGSECDRRCKQLNLRGMLVKAAAIIRDLKGKVEDASSDLLPRDDSDSLNVAVKTDSFIRSRSEIVCRDQGLVYTKDRICAPCDKGYYLKAHDDDFCSPCPVGTFQSNIGQTNCEPCSTGSTTLTAGSYGSYQCSVATMAIGFNGNFADIEALNGISYFDEEENQLK